jgi:hypothetical protein
MVTTGTDRASLSSGRCTVHRYRRDPGASIGDSRAMHGESGRAVGPFAELAEGA